MPQRLQPYAPGAAEIAEIAGTPACELLCGAATTHAARAQLAHALAVGVRARIALTSHTASGQPYQHHLLLEPVFDCLTGQVRQRVASAALAAQ